MAKKFTSLKQFKAVPVILVAAFVFYFCSESVLRQAALAGMVGSGMNVNRIVQRLPASIRASVSSQIELAALREKLKNAEKDRDKIFARVEIARLTSEEELEKAHIYVLNKYPSSPYASSSYLYFFRAGEKKKRSVSAEELLAYIAKLPEQERCMMWYSILMRLKSTGASPKEILAFFKQLSVSPPEYADYRELFLQLSEVAFQAANLDSETRYRELEAGCDSLPYINGTPAGSGRK